MEIEIDGKRMYLYKVGSGSYSEYSEEWWAHEEPMTEPELIRRLIAKQPEIAARCEKWTVDREAFAQERFGCAAAKVTWKSPRKVGDDWVYSPATRRGTDADMAEWMKLYQQPPDVQSEAMVAAGFVAIEAHTTYRTDPIYSYGDHAAGKLLEQLRWELKQSEGRDRDDE